MRTYLKRYRPWNLLPREIVQLSHMHYGLDVGMLGRDFKESRTRYKNAWVYFIISEDGLILSWAHVQLSRNNKSTAMYWTRASQRRKGHGARIHKRIVKDFGKPFVYPHDRISDSFFKSVANIRTRP